MSDDIESLAMTCPICGAEHRFRIKIDRSYLMYNLTSDMLKRKAPVKRYRRNFTCPEKGKPFQATISLEESFGTILNNVSVVPDDIT